MRMRFSWLILGAALVGATCLSPAAVHAQAYNYEVPPVLFTGPLSHPRYEEGGFFTGLQFVFMRQTRPLSDQTLAIRGFQDVDGGITGSAGSFVGSGFQALNTHQLRGPGTYQPGFNATMGWRFESGTTLQASWMHLWDARYSASATLAPPGGFFGNQLSDTFLFSPVYNYSILFAGNPENVAGGNAGSTFGIWNAASLMQITFVQRFDMFDLTSRIPMYASENYRSYAVVGPRIAVLWERFTWQTVDADLDGNATASTTANYSNVASNRLYGVTAGCGNEWFLGDTPAGGFSVSVDTAAGLYIDFAKTRAKYVLADETTAASRARNMWTLAPGLEAKMSLWWYPWEAVSVQLGYNFLGFFNTVSSPQPVDFNVGGVDPEFKRNTFRYLHGLTLGVGFVF